MAPQELADLAGFSVARMQVLHAICDTLIPSLRPYDVDDPHEVEAPSTNHASEKEIAAFYELRGSDDGVPEEVALKMARFLRPADVAAVRMILWLLSTRLGTLALAGRLSLTKNFPFVEAFPGLPLRNREKILRAWCVGSSAALKGLFQVFKGFVLRQFYTKVDKDGKNPVVWKALDYSGPDPRLSSVTMDACDEDLECKIVDMKNAEDSLAKLCKLGMISESDKLEKEIIRISTDAVIIGSGSGGGVVASQLSEAGYKVVILEKGDYFPRTHYSLLEGPSGDMYEGGAFLSTADGGVMVLAGSTLGGGSTINWSAALKTPPHVLHEWAQEHGLELFSSERYAKAMERVYQRLGVQEEAEEENFSNSMLRKGCHALSMHVGNVPRNAPRDHFCGWCGMGCKSGKKQSVNRAWLVDAARTGAVILTGCEARRIVLEKQEPESTKPMRAVGVIAEALKGTKKIEVDAKVVVAACGALWTPPLLRRSGLRNNHIGEHLHLHPVMSTWGYFKEVAPMGRSYEGGIMTSFSRQAANWESSGYGALLMVPSMHPGAFAAFMPWINGRDSKDTMLNFAKTVHFIAITRDSGSGHVTEDRNGRLSIQYKISERDRSNCLIAASNALQVLAAAGATKVGTHNADGAAFECSNTSDSHALEEFLLDVRSTSIRNSSTPLVSAHQMGSCRMGTSSSTSAVDQYGETWEAQGLFVADTSVFPSASGVNPMVTVQSIALCTSQSILDFLKNCH